MTRRAGRRYGPREPHGADHGVPQARSRAAVRSLAWCVADRRAQAAERGDPRRRPAGRARDHAVLDARPERVGRVLRGELRPRGEPRLVGALQRGSRSARARLRSAALRHGAHAPRAPQAQPLHRRPPLLPARRGLARLRDEASLRGGRGAQRPQAFFPTRRELRLDGRSRQRRHRARPRRRADALRSRGELLHEDAFAPDRARRAPVSTAGRNWACTTLDDRARSDARERVPREPRQPRPRGGVAPPLRVRKQPALHRARPRREDALRGRRAAA